MSVRNDRTRVAAQCRRCGNAYAAERWPDRTIRPIGSRSGCACGSTEFRVVGDANEHAGDPSTSAD